MTGLWFMVIPADYLQMCNWNRAIRSNLQASHVLINMFIQMCMVFLQHKWGFFYSQFVWILLKGGIHCWCVSTGCFWPNLHFLCDCSQPFFHHRNFHQCEKPQKTLSHPQKKKKSLCQISLKKVPSRRVGLLWFPVTHEGGADCWRWGSNSAVTQNEVVEEWPMAQELNVTHTKTNSWKGEESLASWLNLCQIF